MNRLTARNATRGAIMGSHVQMANGFWSRFRGLMLRRVLDAEEGLLIDPSYSIHTMFMRFPIDVVFLDDHDRVLKLVEDLRPWRAALRRGARRVLELPVGAATRADLRVGDEVTFTEVV